MADEEGGGVRCITLGCLWLASKLEECPVKVMALLQVYERQMRREDGGVQQVPAVVMPASEEYAQLHCSLISAERVILRELGFICHVDHPHKLIVNMCVLLGGEQDLIQEAWCLANDSFGSSLCVRYKSIVIACGAVWLAARRLGLVLPEDRGAAWWLLFDVTEEDVENVAAEIIWLHQQPRPKYIRLVREEILPAMRRHG